MSISPLINQIKQVKQVKHSDRPIKEITNKLETIGYLRPLKITHNNSISKSDIKLITQWRNQNRKKFFTWFKSTDKKTTFWLQNEYIHNNELIFFVENKNHEPIGHISIGEIDLDQHTCEIGRIIKSNSCKEKGILTQAIQSAIKLAEDLFGIQTITLEVFSDNLRAINLYKRCGFKKTCNFEAISKEEPNKTTWTKGKEIPENKFGITIMTNEIKNQTNSTNPESTFAEEVANNIEALSTDENLQKQGIEFLIESAKKKYSYNFSWMGRPIIQYPQDIVAMQEIVWKSKPDLIIETGIAHGGSLIMYASFLEMMGLTGSHVVGIDIDIRPHNRSALEEHPLFHRITLIEGSSISDTISEKVHSIASNYNKVMLVLDSNHTHEHVLKELELYSGLVSKGCYCIVFDTVVEDMPEDFFPDRPWGKGNNPKTAVHEFLKNNNSFKIDKTIQDKLLITVAPDGYLIKE